VLLFKTKSLNILQLLVVFMADEAVIIELLGNGGDPIRVTVADGTGIEKGTLMSLTDPRTGAAHAAADEAFMGVAAAEKVADDGSTTLAVYTNGIFDIKTDSGTDSAGALMAVSGTANRTQTADAADLLQGSYVGHLLEDAGNGEVAAHRILR
jgi:hypothetical protein